MVSNVALTYSILNCMMVSCGENRIYGKWIYIAPLSKALYRDWELHSPIDARGNHARHQPALREQIGVQDLAQEPLDTNSGEPRFELRTVWFLSSHSTPELVPPSVMIMTTCPNRDARLKVVMFSHGALHTCWYRARIRLVSR